MAKDRSGKKIEIPVSDLELKASQASKGISLFPHTEDIGDGIPCPDQLVSKVIKPKNFKELTEKQKGKIIARMQRNQDEQEVVIANLKKKLQSQEAQLAGLQSQLTACQGNLAQVKRLLDEVLAWKKAVSTSLFSPQLTESQSQQVVPNNNPGNGSIEVETQALVDRGVVKPPMKI